MNRRRFIYDAAKGLLVPFTGAIVRAAGPIPQTPSRGVVVSGGAAASFSDNFNRADSNPMSTTSSSGGTWVIGPGALNDTRIVSNQSEGTGATCGSVVSSPSCAANQFAQFTWGTGNVAINQSGLLLRVQPGTGNGYLLYASAATTLQFYRTDTFAQLGGNLTVAGGMVAGDVLRFEVSGTTLTAYVNGVSQGTTTSSVFSSGQPGVYHGSTGRFIDTFSAGDL